MDIASSNESDVEVDLTRWTALAAAACSAQGVADTAQASLTFLNEDDMTSLNEEHMGKEGPTDVLSFPVDLGAEPLPGVPHVVGDILICPQVAMRNAVDHGVSTDDEIALLVVHGVLHLLGWDHMNDADAELMEARERELLQTYYRPEYA
jgi:probable rRNA maturation factor